MVEKTKVLDRKASPFCAGLFFYILLSLLVTFKGTIHM